MYLYQVLNLYLYFLKKGGVRMLDFSPNVYTKKASMRSICGLVSEQIQTCFGCDETCTYSCIDYCVDDCTAGATDIDQGCYDCYGSCIDWASIWAGK